MRPAVPKTSLPLPDGEGRRKSLGIRLGAMRISPWTESGVALVITLILLSVITFMAVTFLVVSRGEKGTVTTDTDLIIARDGANAGTERAISEILAPMLAFTNEQNFDMWVSTNYVNALGFIPGNKNPTNVNFFYTYPGLGPLSGNDMLQNDANLLYSPPVPVYMTNRVLKTNQLVLYYDANRNGLFDPTGLQPVIGTNGLPLTFADTNGTRILSNYFTGDPQWIGVLERPGLPHSSSNRFLVRLAYIVVPTGKTLDINYVHNYAKLFRPTMPNGAGDGLFRNMGVGTWEINLGGFFVDLNTNYWPYPANNTLGSRYFYSTNPTVANTGTAFDDAVSLLRYRYNGSFNNLMAAGTMFPATITPVTMAFGRDWVDEYTRGPLMIGDWWTPSQDTDANLVQRTPWSGSDNPNHFFSPQEWFDKSRITNSPPIPGALTFADRIMRAGLQTNSYDRYTYFRLLSQLGSDSSPEPPDRMNLNWDNLTPVNGVASVTNFLPWRPITFFTNAALRLLANAGYGSNVLLNGKFQIQIYPTNFYTPSVHRLLQLAANIYDSTTNYGQSISPGSTNLINFPTVFRPIFSTGAGSKGGGSPDQISIVGFQEVPDASIATTAIPLIRDLNDPNDRLSLKPTDMVYGVPLVVGAKKSVPNFNEFAMQTHMYVTRKLEFRRPLGVANAPVNETNQMYVVGVTNVFAVEGWNSYTNLIQRNLRLLVAADITMVYSNEFGILRSNRFSQSADIRTNFWPGFLAPGSFKIPLSNSVTFLPTSTYHQAPPSFQPLTRQFERGAGFPVPHWWVTMSARTRFIVVDEGSNHLLDYVNLNSTEDPIDLTAKLMEDGVCNAPDGNAGSQWCTNRVQNSASVFAPTYGIINQIHVGDGSVTPDSWNNFNMDPAIGADKPKGIAGFRYNLYGISTPGYGPFFQSNVFYSPFNPFRIIYQHTTLQANDPLVHYTVGDLVNLQKTNNVDFIPQNPPVQNIGRINDRYEPWTAALSAHSKSPTLFDLSIKDPGVTRSDDWEFPTNKFPNVGWLGRVHRGTPWQTVYLKAPIANLDLWRVWTGNGVIATNWDGKGSTNFDAELSMPFRDRYIMDVFSAAPNDNATRGQLSINQTNLAAWSAVLSGVIALTNVVSDSDIAVNPFLPPSNAPLLINPAGVYDPLNRATYPPVVRIVEGINNARANTNLFPKRVFTRVGDILSVPELTVGSSYLFPTNYVGVYPNGHWSGASPFLNLGNPASINIRSTTPGDHLTAQQRNLLNDAAVERIPQQIFGLIRLDQAPRFVIYAYGQALKPAPHSILTSGPFFGLCTNYQVTAEAATRTVVRIEGAPTNPHAVIESFNVLQPD